MHSHAECCAHFIRPGRMKCAQRLASRGGGEFSPPCPDLQESRGNLCGESSDIANVRDGLASISHPERRMDWFVHAFPFRSVFACFVVPLPAVGEWLRPAFGSSVERTRHFRRTITAIPTLFEVGTQYDFLPCSLSLTSRQRRRSPSGCPPRASRR